MAENYDSAIRRRLGVINDMGASATGFAQQAAMRQPGVTDSPMRMPGNVNQGASMRMPGGPGGSGYTGPRGNQQALLNFGRYLQSQGYTVGENPAFGHVGTHSKGSRHYSGRAIDVNHGAGTSRREQAYLDKIVGLAKLYGLRSIWRQKDHFNHAHFDY